MVMGSRLGLPGKGGAGVPLKLGSDLNDGTVLRPSPWTALRSSFSAQQWEAFRAQLSPALQTQLTNLFQETDWEIFYHDLYALSGDLRRSGNPGTAEALLGFLSRETDEEYPCPAPALRTRAQSDLDLMAGRGSFGRLLEHHMSHFVEGVTDPIALISMGAAGLTFGASRLATFGLLSRTRAFPLLTRGWGAQALAFGVGVGAESTAFMGVGRGLRALSGQGQDWSAQALEREFLGTAMMLGLLKFNGGVARSLLGQHAPGWQAGLSRAARIPHVVLPQLAMFSGIYGTHWLEGQLGWRPQQATGGAVIESLVTLVQFNAMGRLMEGAFGPRYAQMNQDLHRRSEALRQSLRASFRLPHLNLPSPLVPERVGGLRGDSSPARSGNKPFTPPQVMLMTGKGDGGGRGTKGYEDMGRAITQEATPEQKAAASSSPPSDKMIRPPRPEETMDAPVSAVDKAKASSSNPPSARSSQEFDLMVGMELEMGKYTVRERVGQGGMKEVWRLHEHGFDREVALYLPLRQYRERLAKRFENEYRLQAHLPPRWRVEHHALLELARGLRAPVVEYVPGHDLYHFVSEVRMDPKGMNQQLPLSRRLEIMAQLCEAVQANHEMGVLHRDIKPENVRIDKNGRVRLMDYGIAKLLHEVSTGPAKGLSLPPEMLQEMGSNHTRPGTVVGTPGYIAPEILYPEIYGPKIDPRQAEVFSLGSVLYELMTGYRPFSEFRKGNPMKGEAPLVPEQDTQGYTVVKMQKTLQGTPQNRIPGFAQMLPFVAGDPLYSRIEEIARRAMSPILQERYQSAEEMRQALLMAEPWVEKQNLDEVYHEMTALESELSRVGPNFQVEGARDPYQTNEIVAVEQNLRYLRTRWLREGETLIQGLQVAMGGRPFPEAQRLIADLSWQQLNHPGSRIHPTDERVLKQRVETNDVSSNGTPGGLMRQILREGVDVRIQVSSLDPSHQEPIEARLSLIQIRPETNSRGIETGNFQEAGSLSLGTLIDSFDGYRLKPGYYVFEWQAEGFAPMRVPIEINRDQALGAMRNREPLTLDFELVPQDLVPEGMVVIHRTEGTVGHNYYFDGDTALATSFPMQKRPIATMAVSRDPVTVGDYREFIEALIEQNNRLNGSNSSAFREELRRIYNLIPRTTTALEARGPLAKFIERFSSERPANGTPFWVIEEGKKFKLLRGNEAHLVDPTTHQDPFGVEIHNEQPVSNISYETALEYLAWRSRRDNVTYRMIGADEKEIVARNGFDWRFPFGNGSLTDALVATRGSFENPDASFPQRVGTHPMGTYRDISLYGVRDLLGNIREFTSTRDAAGSIFLSGGNIALNLGANFNPSSRYILNQNQIWDQSGGIRLALDLEPSEGRAGE